MSKLISGVSKKSTWRNHLARHEASGKSVTNFCRDEAISASNFYARRSRRRFTPAHISHLQKKTTPFIDLGFINDSAKTPSFTHTIIEVHLDLGAGMLLTITRH